MNKPIRGAEPVTQLAEDQIADFLVAHPDFFERHGAVLARIKLPHQRGSAAISLVERQVLVLRDKHAALEKKLHELIENGRANDAISDRLHRLTRRLLRARDAAGVVAALGYAALSLAVSIFETFFESGRPRSGQIRDTQRDYLFGGEGSQVGSTVLIPLGERAGLGLLAIASHDTERYLPTMSTDYLVRIGEIVTEAVSARPA